MHFEDKEALLAAIAQEGFHLLAQHIMEARQAVAGEWHKELHAGSRAYVNFMLSHPGHAQVMFRHYDAEKHADPIQTAIETLTPLRELIEEGQAKGLVRTGDSQQIATLIWSLLHGIAMILIARQGAPAVMGDATADQLTERFIDMLYTGIQ
jgi:AcrR family transcriptional regulator